MWVQVSSLVFIQATFVRTRTYAHTAAARTTGVHVRTCVSARPRSRVTATTRHPSSLYVRVKYCLLLLLHRLHRVYPCREERRQMSESFSPPFSPFLSFFLARVFVGGDGGDELHKGVSHNCRNGPTKGDYLGWFLQRRLFRFARSKYQCRGCYIYIYLICLHSPRDPF